jgi:hypothetical protein
MPHSIHPNNTGRSRAFEAPASIGITWTAGACRFHHLSVGDDGDGGSMR